MGKVQIVTKHEIIQFLTMHKQELFEKYSVTKIGLIGSYARNEQNDYSDIDLLIEFKTDTQNIFKLKLDLKQYLKKNFNRDIDLCREKYLKPFAKKHILGEVIYA